MALRKRNFVQCVEKVRTNAQKMKKLTKCKAVRVCREIRAMLVQMYRKVQEIDGKTHESALKTHGSALYLINNAREVHYFCVKMVKNNEKNE